MLIDEGSVVAAKPAKFPKPVVEAIRAGKILGIRAGAKPHRIIGIWAGGG
jgi:hypothetical protein